MDGLEAVMQQLKADAHPEKVADMARVGLGGQGRLGVAVPDLRRLARQAGRSHSLALDLWATGIPEARILAAMVDDPALLTEEQMDNWVAAFEAWDVCDQVCDNLFRHSPLAWKKILDWSEREEEFVKRAAFALIACLAWHDRSATDEAFVSLLPVIVRGATDGRNYVKKAVSWALRNIGKRNQELHRAALEAAAQMAAMDNRAARWVAADVTKELNSPAVLGRLGL